MLEFGKQAFHKTSIQRFVMPPKVTSVSNGLFSGNIALVSATLHERITTIEDWAFDYCSGLTEVNGGESVTRYGKNSFSRTKSLRNFRFSKRTEKIDDSAFESSGLTAIGLKFSLLSTT